MEDKNMQSIDHMVKVSVRYVHIPLYQALTIPPPQTVKRVEVIRAEIMRTCWLMRGS